MPKPDRSISEVSDQLIALHREVGSLATNAIHCRPNWRLVFARGPLRRLEDRLDAHFKTFMNLDADLVVHANPPDRDINANLLAASRFQMYFGVRDSVRGLLSDTNGVLASVRNQLDFRSSLLLSVVAILIALADVDLLGLLKGWW